MQSKFTDLKYLLDPRLFGSDMVFYDFNSEFIVIKDDIYQFIFRNYGIHDVEIDTACYIAKLRMELYIDSLCDHYSKVDTEEQNARHFDIIHGRPGTLTYAFLLKDWLSYWRTNIREGVLNSYKSKEDFFDKLYEDRKYYLFGNHSMDEIKTLFKNNGG